MHPVLCVGQAVHQEIVSLHEAIVWGRVLIEPTSGVHEHCLSRPDVLDVHLGVEQRLVGPAKLE